MKNIITSLLFITITFVSFCKAQTVQSFTSAGTQDQYVPVVFSFNHKPFSISRPDIHQNRNWLAYGIATINGAGYGWGSGNRMIKLENYTYGMKNSDNTGGVFSYIGKVLCEWRSLGIIVYLRGGTTYYTDGVVQRNDGTYTAEAGSQKNLSAVPITESGFNILSGIYSANWEIDANTRSINDASINTENIYSSNGNVGIGTSTPSTKLDVRGIISTPEIAFRNADGGDDSDPYRMRKVRTSSNNNWLELQLNDDFNESFRIYGNSCEGYNCAEYSGNLYHSFDTQGNVYHKGNVGIGISNPQNKLDVNGTVHAKEVKVDMAGWADFVFQKEYSLPTLEEVEKHINEKGHLPNIPNAKDVIESGLSLGENQKLLLQKIEELMLYSIEQYKVNKQQSELLQKQIEINKALEQRLEKLEKK